MTIEPRGTTAPGSPLLPDLIARQAATRPAAVAIEQADRRLSYSDLLGSADAVASWLRARSVGTDDRVAVSCERSIEYVVAALGAMRAGAAYLPVDPAYPEPRRAFMLADAGVTEILDRATVQRLASAPTKADPTVPAGRPRLRHLHVRVDGRAQGRGHRAASLANLVAWYHDEFGPGPADRFCLCAGVGFDATVWRFWPRWPPERPCCHPRRDADARPPTR